MRTLIRVSVAVVLLWAGGASAQTPNRAPAATKAVATPPAAAVAGTPGPIFTIGAGDLLNINVWREPELSGDVVVRPDGRITVPLIKEVTAAGLTAQQLEATLQQLALRYVEDPNVTVTVREIKSRQVFITGNVGRPGAYPLNGPTTVLQFIAQAGGVLEYAKSEELMIMRTENGRQTTFRFNYKDITKRKNLSQNIELKPGDTVIVP